jgi:hypothetical protein
MVELCIAMGHAAPSESSCGNQYDTVRVARGQTKERRRREQKLALQGLVGHSPCDTWRLARGSLHI